MTSELKPCPFCGSKAELKTAYETPKSIEGQTEDVEYIAFVDCSSCLEDVFFIRAFSNSPEKAQEAVTKALNTRATPSADPLAELPVVAYQVFNKDVPFLRGCLQYNGIVDSEDTRHLVVKCLVREEHAVAIITAQAHEIARLKSDRLYVVGCNDGYKAAEAELAQIKAQKPIAKVVSAHGDPEAFGERELQIIADIQKMPYNTPLYAAPVSDSLKAENERLRKAVRVATLKLAKEGWDLNFLIQRQMPSTWRPAMTRDELLIEAAKLIDPHPFKSYDDLKSYCLSKGDTESAAYECAEGIHGRDCSELINTAGKICDLLFAALQEPTRAMYESAHGHYEGEAFLPHGLWQAMLNASPLAPEGGKQ